MLVDGTACSGPSLGLQFHLREGPKFEMYRKQTGFTLGLVEEDFRSRWFRQWASFNELSCLSMDMTWKGLAVS